MDPDKDLTVAAHAQGRRGGNGGEANLKNKFVPVKEKKSRRDKKDRKHKSRSFRGRERDYVDKNTLKIPNENKEL